VAVFFLISGGRFSEPRDPQTVACARLDAASGEVTAHVDAAVSGVDTAAVTIDGACDVNGPGVGLLRLLCPYRQPRQQGAVCARTLSPSAEDNYCCDGFFPVLLAGARGFGREPRHINHSRKRC